MSIRLNKAIRELNIGLQTAVEFLEQKKELGEVKAELSYKLNDAQYHALVEKFKQDAALHNDAEKLFKKEKKHSSSTKQTPSKPDDKPDGDVFETSHIQKYTPVGKINLDEVGKPKTQKSQAKTNQQAQPAAKAAAVSPQPEAQPAANNSQKSEPQQPAKAPAAQEKPAAAAPSAASAKPSEAASGKSSEGSSAPVAPKQTSAPTQPEAPSAAQRPAPSQPKQPVQHPQQQSAKPEGQAQKSGNQAPKAAETSGKPASQPAQQNQSSSKNGSQSLSRNGGQNQRKNDSQPGKPSQPIKHEKVPEAAKVAESEGGVFRPKSEIQLLNNTGVNVVGHIDLNSLNQSTRPKRKSKEEKRKEREDKAQQQRGGGERRKRQRINNKERVDINAAANQQGRGRNNQSNNQNQGGKKKNRKRNQKPVEMNDEDVARQVKETLARLTSKQTQNKKGAKYRKEKREAVQEKLAQDAKAERKESKTLKLTEFVTVSELATMMGIGVNQVISTLMSIGVMASINQRLDAETINLVADEFGFKTEYVSAEVQEAVSEEEDDEADLVPRAPIVTVMGHVDHGKTSLLDHIRNTNVIAGEAGGITQHIGAYNVQLPNGRRITFLDTPGHEAFTAMRARGAQVTDIAIIIIAADDSVMPTTKEAIAHCQAAGVPMVFAINKIDKPGANPDKIREDLANMNLLVEEWGGKYQCQEISAKKGIGVEELLDKVLLEADMLDLKANPNRKATGTVIESSLDKGRGYVSTVLVSNGTLHVGDYVIAGTSWGRIKAMFNERNQRIDNVKPAEPAIILGLNGAPTAGDQFHVLDSEQEVREIANKREQLQREQSLRTQTRTTLSDISRRIARGEFHELNIIVKGDTDGSVEALSDSLIKLSTEKVKVSVIYKAVGQISESDVTLADASDAIIVGFQVRPSAAARKQAEQSGVEINTYSVIYDAIDDVKSAMVGMLDKVKKEVVTGQVEVKQVYHISKVGTVAGGLVTEGKVHSKDKARVVRDGIVVHTAAIAALKRYKDDVKEVPSGMECGISLVNYNDLQEGDILETYTEIEVEQKL